MNLNDFFNTHANMGKKKRLEDVILKNMGVSKTQFKSWPQTDYSTNIHTSDVFWGLIEKAKHIRIIGDYDCDGICASHTGKKAILSQYPDKDIKIYIPRRFSEGYGINEHIVNKIIEEGDCENTLIITVDNGIAAGETLALAKIAGITVAVTDHHTLADDKPLPVADFVVNPAVSRLSNPFKSKLYCGAGVIYKLLEPRLSEAVKNELRQFVALATYADVMTLHEENWVLCREFMQNAKEGNVAPALKELLFASGYDPQYTDEAYFGFVLGPMFNAPGRLYDDGGQIVLEYLDNPTIEGAERLCQINAERKALVKDQMAMVERFIEENNLSDKYPLWIHVPGLHEGVVGILAGHLVEKYHAPAFVVTENEKAGCLKGSARTDGKLNVFQYLKENEENLVGFGGHCGAAGLRLTKEQFALFSEKATEHTAEGSHLVPDIEVLPSEARECYEEMEEYRPFGEGNPYPVFKISMNLKDKNIRTSIAGAGTLIARTNDVKFVRFGYVEDKKKLANPYKFEMIGVLEQNVYMGSAEVQFKAIEISGCEKEKEVSIDIPKDYGYEELTF